MRTGGSIEDVLKCLNNYTYKQSDNSIDDPSESDSPNELKKAPESKKETAPQSNSDDTDLRDAFKFCKDSTK